MTRCLVTGATGFVGGHVAEAIRKRGWEVRTIARSTSDVSLMKQLGVEIIEGDLADPATVERACQDIDSVVHCAAKVGEWGPIEEYRKFNVDAFEVLMKACLNKNLARFVLVSSLGVYAARDHFGTDETEPLPTKHIDSYTQTKVEAENLAMKYYREQKLPLVVLRPGFIYGPRDRTVMPRILKNLRIRLLSYFSSREKKINNSYVGNVVEAVLLALDKPEAIGQIYNIRDGELVTKKVFFETIADLAGLPRPFATHPLIGGRIAAAIMETAGRTFGFAPFINQARIKFMGLNLDYSIAKAQRDLGYHPSTNFDTGIRQTIDWLKQEGRIK